MVVYSPTALLQYCTVVHKYFIKMGNICCLKEDDRTLRTQIWTTTQRQYSHVQQQEQTQKIELSYSFRRSMTIQYMSFLSKIYKREDQEAYKQRTKYRLAEYDMSDSDNLNRQGFMDAVLINQDHGKYECKMKKIAKQTLMKDKSSLKQLIVQHLATKYLSSKFVVRHIYDHQNNTDLHIFYDLQQFVTIEQIYQSAQLKNMFQRDLENNVRFIAAGIILGLEELHAFDLVCRYVDLKSVAICGDGYPCLIDLSMLASEGHQGVSVQSSPYLSLEQYKKGVLTRAVDFWRLGILIYYMICNQYPNFSLFKEHSFSHAKISPSLSDLVNKLIIYNSNKRLGISNIEQLKNHSFFHDFQWSKYKLHQLNSPFLQYLNPAPRKTPQGICSFDLSSKKPSFLRQFDQDNNFYISYISKQIQQSYTKQQILQSSMNDSSNSQKMPIKHYHFNLYDKQYYFLD